MSKLRVTQVRSIIDRPERQKAHDEGDWLA